MRPSISLSLILIIATAASMRLVPSEQVAYDGTALFFESERISVPDGTLVRADGDDRMYYAQDGRVHWIDSVQTFAKHGFRDEDVRVIPPGELARYRQGEPITAVSRVVLPAEAHILPDLAPLAPYDLRLATVGGRTVIRFTGSVWNKGYRPFRMASENQTVAASGQDGTEDVYQHVTAEDGSIRKTFVGTFVWHAAHNHHHYSRFAEYLLEPALLPPGTRMLSAGARQKTSFCLRDDERMAADVPWAPERPFFTACDAQGQGISPGWVDVYAHTLPDQYVDVHDLPPGIYALSILVDPAGLFIEERADNNLATTLIELDVRRWVLRTVAVLSPFPTLRNTAMDGTLLRDVERGNVYVVERGRKRWLRSVDIFASYGHSWSAVYPVTAAVADAFPDQQLIRRQGTDEVFVLNAQGYRRHIRDASVLASYGWTAADIVDVNDLEFSSYPEAELIMLPGNTEVYSFQEGVKRPFSTLAALQAIGHNLDGLHIVNRTDFDTYRDN